MRTIRSHNFLAAISCFVLAACFLAVNGASAQTSPQKLSFAVASIKTDKSTGFTRSSFVLDDTDSFRPEDPHGRLSASYPLLVYLEFAYKQWLSPKQTDALLSKLPAWAATERFRIEARSDGNPTKDQMRLMLRSLLEERFRLRAHISPQSTEALLLVLKKPGTLGPQLRPHPASDDCKSTSMPKPGESGEIRPPCQSHTAIVRANRSISLAGRELTMARIAQAITSMPGSEKTFLDRTGLEGSYDFSLQWFASAENEIPVDANTLPELSGQSLYAALSNQLGLKVKAEKVVLDTLVIDSVEHPTED